MIIAVNIENTNISVGGFEGEELTFVAKIATDLNKTADQYACEFQNIFGLNHISSERMDGAVFCSVVPSLSTVICQAVGKLSACPLLIVSTGIKTGLNIKIDHPKQLGSDLVCSAVRAVHISKLPCIVVDMSTATTFTALDENGALVGSSIAPGVKIGLDALRHHAAQLPSISIENLADGILGKNTVHAMQSGIVYGSAALVDGMVARYDAVLGGNASVLMTGSYGSFIAPYCHCKVTVEENLVLYGLHMIWEKNQVRKGTFSTK